MTERITRSRINEIPVGNYQQPTTDEMFDFMQSARDKQKTRRNFLAEHPEARIQVDPAPLRQILPDSALICYTGSSVARNRSIRGSDIDGAIVITHKPSTGDQQRQYVFELRRQGFKVYSPEQIARINDGNYLADDEDKRTDIAFKVITFETFNEFEERRRAGVTLVHAKLFIVYADEDVA